MKNNFQMQNNFQRKNIKKDIEKLKGPPFDFRKN